ncbi:MAG: FHA domain-containing protein [Anaerolineales bacterium]|jgi:hypothetical protein
MEAPATKSCPVCGQKNELSAATCRNCGSPLEAGPVGPTTTKRVTGRRGIPEQLLQAPTPSAQKQAKPPKDGISFYVEGYEAPIDIRRDAEFILGRKVTGALAETLVDLNPFGGYEKGVSRRHAMIRRKGDGYEILDMGSTNGTWLNQYLLLPDKPYPLKSGTQIRLGRLSLLVLFEKTTSEH